MNFLNRNFKLFFSQQQIINYCLLVDKFVESDKFSVEAVEQTLLLHSVNEEKSEKHLQVIKGRVHKQTKTKRLAKLAVFCAIFKCRFSGTWFPRH
jgi:hypothetical protein